jgi:glycosyltransferase involved in cell wall biosynthesis
MKLLYLVQRYGEEIVGGSEAACRSFAENLVRHGHEVDVLTSCAQSYVTWENYFPPGRSLVNGVTVHRLSVSGPRRPERFGPMDGFLMSGKGRPSWFQHRRWAKLMGPDMPELGTWLSQNIKNYDAAVFMTYLYATTTQGIFDVAGRIPVVFQPTAHDEPPMRIPMFHSVFRQPDSFLFFTPEEREVVRTKFLFEPAGEVLGMGIDLDPMTEPEAQTRIALNIGDDPYITYVGRLDPMKGVRELARFFIEYKQRNPSRLKLVLAGEAVAEIPSHPDIVTTGYLDESRKQGLIAGSLALVQSSYFESFSIVLCEAWVQHRPALVQGASPVLRGQACRSGGAIPYEGFAEFEAAVEMLLRDSALVTSLGEQGRKYVEDNYSWPRVLEKFDLALETAVTRFAERRVKLRVGDQREISRPVNGVKD